MPENYQRVPGSDQIYPYNAKHRYGFEKSFSISFPEDIGLAVSEELDQTKIPPYLFQIYARFFDLGWIKDYGTQCILMSCVLRRILRLHGYPATLKQVILYWENDRKKQHQITGGFKEFMDNPDQIDAHLVVYSGDYLLDFACSHLFKTSFTNPMAFIASSDSRWNNEYQSFGDIHGKACWTPSHPVHPIIKHWRFEQKQKELSLVRQYFRIFQF